MKRLRKKSYHKTVISSSACSSVRHVDLKEAESSSAETSQIRSNVESYGAIENMEESEEERDGDAMKYREESMDEGYEEGYFSLYDCDAATYYKSSEIMG